MHVTHQWSGKHHNLLLLHVIWQNNALKPAAAAEITGRSIIKIPATIRHMSNSLQLHKQLQADSVPPVFFVTACLLMIYLDHVLNGKCFLPVNSDKSLCMPGGVLHVVTSRATYMSYIATCRQSFASAPDPSMVLCDIESLNVEQLHNLSHLHMIDGWDHLTVEQHQSCLVQHFCVEACNIVSTDNNLPICQHPLPDASSNDYDSSQGVNQLRRLLKTYMTSLRKGKAATQRIRRVADAKQAETEYLKDLRTNWPQLVPHALKDKLLKSFRDATSSQTLCEYTCAVCGESKFNLSLLNARHNGLVPDPFVENHPLKDLAIEPLGVVNSAEPGQPLLRICPIPAELSELTVVEEAMIARRRAKCWVLHLNDNDGDTDGIWRSNSTKMIFPARAEDVNPRA
ncbi:hypothetical protein JB92DRAFT_3096701 [Gautieria morchelliformis]|nr:hypothetical protein JB92DRAFT_3096701 [Gautieria morchelliformis]